MRIKKYTGAALVDYIIPTVVVGLVVGMGIYYMNSSGLLVKFLAGSSNMKVDMSSGMATLGNVNTESTGPITAGDLGGTPEKPVTKCENGNCVIDYGDFALNGIPENFDEYIQAGGSSGGTDKLIDLINQIADQLEKDGDIAGAQEYRDLANLGHFISTAQKNFEDNVKDCTDNICINNQAGALSKLDLPDNLKSILTGYDFISGGTNILTTFNQIGYSRSIKNNISTNFCYQPNVSPAYAFVNKYDQIMTNSKYSSTMKDVTTQLYKQVSNIGDNLASNFLTVFNNGLTPATYDPMTGLKLTAGSTRDDSITTENFTHPQFSKNTNLGSQLICINGKNTDTGVACN